MNPFGYFRRSRCFSSGSSEEPRTSNTKVTLDSDLFTFCPPGPEARAKVFSVCFLRSFIESIFQDEDEGGGSQSKAPSFSLHLTPVPYSFEPHHQLLPPPPPPKLPPLKPPKLDPPELPPPKLLPPPQPLLPPPFHQRSFPAL